jgi:hypothetical protein
MKRGPTSFGLVATETKSNLTVDPQLNYMYIKLLTIVMKFVIYWKKSCKAKEGGKYHCMTAHLRVYCYAQYMIFSCRPSE